LWAGSTLEESHWEQIRGWVCGLSSAIPFRDASLPLLSKRSMRFQWIHLSLYPHSPRELERLKLMLFSLQTEVKYKLKINFLETVKNANVKYINLHVKIKSQINAQKINTNAISFDFKIYLQ